MVKQKFELAGKAIRMITYVIFFISLAAIFSIHLDLNRSMMIIQNKVDAASAMRDQLQSLTDLDFYYRGNAESVKESLSQYTKKFDSQYHTKFFKTGLGEIKNFLEFRGSGIEFTKVVDMTKNELVQLLAMSEEKKLKGSVFLNKALAIFSESSNGFQAIFIRDDLRNMITLLRDFKNSLDTTKIGATQRLDFAAQASRIQNKIEKIENRNGYFTKSLPVISRLQKKIGLALSYLNQFQQIEIENKSNAQSIDASFMRISLAMLFLVMVSTFVSKKRRNEKVREEKKENDDNAVDVNGVNREDQIADMTTAHLLENYESYASVVLDKDEKIFWSNKAFRDLTGLASPTSRSWYHVLDNNIMVTTGGVHVEGEVRVLGKGDRPYKMESKSAKTEDGDFRLIQFAPIYNYNVEIAGTLRRLEDYKDLPEAYVFDVGELVEEVTEDLRVLFQSTNTVLSIQQDYPIYVAISRESSTKAFRTLINGILLYLGERKSQHRITIEIMKVKGQIVLKTNISDIKFDNVTAPMVLRDKTFPSLASYMEQVERIMERYQGTLVLKNLVGDEGRKCFGVIEMRIQERDDSILDFTKLEKKRRVSRAVKTAEKVKKQKSSTNSSFH